MRPVLYVLSFLAVMALGFWAYRENYATQAALRDVTDLQNEIAGLRESLSIERAEWAYLNRPDRLRDLGTLNFDRLGLLPMEPSQFGAVNAVAFPPAPLVTNLPLDGTEMVSGVLDTSADAEQTP
ncbi:cell division protein FtsL [Cypionkella aquatica]|uniref:Cell division protein FtsL n=1 Tax=Cypionkella aquatica TaxID=1756042 RepID=A0AA37U7L7_9RHOB|nr:cell division protein FtsL [Cypionkella aquatica]GLS86936.1 cell division protein FtsL [Cypionkella aquatica]